MNEADPLVSEKLDAADYRGFRKQSVKA